MLLKFSDEARLYSRDYVIVKEVEKAWRTDLERFHNALFVHVSKELGDLRSLGKSEYRYWYLERWKTKQCPLYLWQPVCYPELLRDSLVEMFLYYSDDRKLWETVHPEMQSQASAALGDVIGLETENGKPNSYRPVVLRVPWKVDPLEETAPVLIEAIRALDKIVPALTCLANASKAEAENAG